MRTESRSKLYTNYCLTLQENYFHISILTDMKVRNSWRWITDSIWISILFARLPQAVFALALMNCFYFNIYLLKIRPQDHIFFNIVVCWFHKKGRNSLKKKIQYGIPTLWRFSRIIIWASTWAPGFITPFTTRTSLRSKWKSSSKYVITYK